MRPPYSSVRVVVNASGTSVGGFGYDEFGNPTDPRNDGVVDTSTSFALARLAFVKSGPIFRRGPSYGEGVSGRLVSQGEFDATKQTLGQMGIEIDLCRNLSLS